MSKKIDVRADRIMRALLRAGDISVQELVEQIGTSAPSIRRDLARLEKRGLVLRTHGGATLVEQLLYEPFRHDTSFQARELRMADEKRRIGLAASELIAEKETIGLTAGTTTTQIGRSLRHRRGISVITNALNIGMELCNQPAIKTTLTGGSLAWAWTFALAGQPALNTLRDVYLDKAFLSVTGFDLERGVTTLETEEATVSLAMLRQAKEVIVVADSSKIGHVSPALICPISAIHVLVTDSAVPADLVKALKAKGIKVVIA
ncbi:DeoR family transcriptional regulator of aga operon [Granulicella aggregans]|uniref:DeoR family transcriptional regulator of aga operon n=1 Tax=Granulicella aggregans TaxID=474949 RepID=A0A7W7ZA32_9BACT|nr:DeoR/GlpR family DNA-binding transcription regulator [Granulicella aggregans]MBB5055972.1 DeoR family transcriptional regulator of aga operon [Granulicella aggregans]